MRKLVQKSIRNKGRFILKVLADTLMINTLKDSVDNKKRVYLAPLRFLLYII